MLIQKAHEIIKEVTPIVVDIYGVEPKVNNIHVSNKFTRTMGRANSKFEIILCGKAYEGHHESNAFRNTVIHEFCHLYDYLLYGRFGHSSTWEKLMADCGEKANRYMTKEKIDEIGYVKPVRKTKTYTYYCRCQSFELSQKRHSNAQKGMKYRCNKCKFTIEHNVDIRINHE